MPTVWIPPQLRDLTGGQGLIRVSGATVHQVLKNLEAIHPGVWDEGIFTHPKVSQQRVAWLYELFKKVSDSPEYKKRLQDLGAFPSMMGPEQLQKETSDTAKLLEPLVMELGLHKSQVK